MTSAAIRDIEVLTPTWRELESQTHVKLRAIESERHYRAMISFMNDLLDMVGDRETHPLMGLLDEKVLVVVTSSMARILAVGAAKRHLSDPPPEADPCPI